MYEDRIYDCFRETHFNARLDGDVNNARLDIKSKHSSAKSRSRTPGHSACLKSMSRTIAMQGLALAAITASEKHILMLDDVYNARLDVKSKQSHSSTKFRSRAPGHSACLKGISMKITMQGLTLEDLTVSEKFT